MAKKERSQQDLIRDARKRLGKTNAELAAELGKSAKTIEAWLLPADNKAHRAMPKSARLLLAALLTQHRAKSAR